MPATGSVENTESGREPHQEPGQREFALGSEAILAALDVYQGRTDSPRLRANLQALFEYFTPVTVTTGEDELIWNNVVLNKHGQPFDAIRFRSPLDEPADLYWIASAEPTFQSWNIYPMQGAMQGFLNYHRINLDGQLELPDPEFVVAQRLLGGRIRPNVDYVIWFLAPHHQQSELACAIRLLTAAQREESLDEREFLRTIAPLGMVEHSESEPTPAESTLAPD